MKKIENEILKAFNELKKKVTLTITDFEELETMFNLKFLKVQRQRQRLEKSRDNWKAKYLKLKNESNNL